MLSVVIPTLNDERRLVRTLACLVPGAADGLIVEAILADGGSSDETEAVGDMAGCRQIQGPADRGARLAAAAATAKAPWLLFIAPGVVLDEGWIRETRGFLDQVARNGETGRRAAIFAHGVDGFGTATQLAALKARLAFAAGFGPTASQALLISAAHYRANGGHRPGQDSERALARRIGRRALSVLRTRATALVM